MKTYIITAIFLLTLPLGYAQFQPVDNKAVAYPGCGYDFNCFQEKSVKNENLQREEQEEEEPIEEFEIENKRIEELKENGEQPGLNQ